MPFLSRTQMIPTRNDSFLPQQIVMWLIFVALILGAHNVGVINKTRNCVERAVSWLTVPYHNRKTLYSRLSRVSQGTGSTVQELPLVRYNESHVILALNKESPRVLHPARWRVTTPLPVHAREIPKYIALLFREVDIKNRAKMVADICIHSESIFYHCIITWTHPKKFYAEQAKPYNIIDHQSVTGRKKNWLGKSKKKIIYATTVQTPYTRVSSNDYPCIVIFLHFFMDRFFSISIGMALQYAWLLTKSRLSFNLGVRCFMFY